MLLFLRVSFAANSTIAFVLAITIVSLIETLIIAQYCRARRLESETDEKV